MLWFSVPADLTDNIKASQNQYTPEKQKEAITTVYNTLVANRKVELNTLIETAKKAEEKNNA